MADTLRVKYSERLLSDVEKKVTKTQFFNRAPFALIAIFLNILTQIYNFTFVNFKTSAIQSVNFEYKYSPCTLGINSVKFDCYYISIIFSKYDNKILAVSLNMICAITITFCSTNESFIKIFVKIF